MVVDVKTPKCCGTCKHWENSTRTVTTFEQYGSIGNCKVTSKLERYASKCKCWAEKQK